MSPASDQQEVRIVQDDCSGGIGSRVSLVGAVGRNLTSKFVKDAINWWFRPKRAISLKAGSRDISSVALAEKPTSIGKFYASGGNKLYVATDDGLSGGKIFRLTTSGKTQQTLAPGFTATAAKWRFEMANGILVATQIGNSGAPQFFIGTNPSDTWHSLVLPKPASAITFNADSAGGFLTDTKVYYWRHRYRYRDGSSLAGPVSASNTMNTPNLTANLIIPLPGAARSDYLGWTLERTDQNGSATGPFYFVADGTAATYADGLADSSLGYRADETLHGEPVAMDGVIFHKDRLFGWRGSTVYLSNLIVDEEGTGIANWIGDQTFSLDKDDGDSIQGAIRQGDRLLFGKRNSVHVIEGNDVDSFVTRRIADGIGFCGPRCACSVGPTVFFCAGNGRLFVARGDSIEPWLDEALGDQLEAMDTTYDADVLAVNYRGEAVLFWHRRVDSPSQRDVLGWDLRFGTPIRFQNPPAIDALTPKDGSDFGSAKLLLADPVIRDPVVTSDPASNPSFMFWRDPRGASTQVYGQSLANADGFPLWSLNGNQESLSTGASQALYAACCGDGTGRVFVAFGDNRGGSRVDVYIQLLAADGTPQYAAGGVLISSGTRPCDQIRVCSDGAGGAIAAWIEYNGASLDYVYAQRVNAAGVKQWNAGAPVKVFDRNISGSGIITTLRILPRPSSSCWIVANNANTAFGLRYARLDSSGAALGTSMGDYIANAQQHLAVARDSAGAMFVAYQTTAYGDIFVRKINLDGTTAWTTNATTGRVSATTPAIVGDGANGVIFAWHDSSGVFGSGSSHMRAQRVTSAGALAWITGGVPMSTPAANSFTLRSAVMDGSGGAIFAWENFTNSFSYANRVDPTGQIQWGSGGVQVGPASSLLPEIVTDGAGGALALVSYLGTDLRAIRVATDGTYPWGQSGVVVVAATGIQEKHVIAFTDTPQGEYPPTATAGYHVWSGLEGLREFQAVDGSGGSPIRGEIVSHRYDAGLPEHIKDAEWFELIVNKGAGEFSVTVEGDAGAFASISLESEVAGFRCDDGTLLDTPECACALTGEDTIDSGLPPNTEGRGLKVTVIGEFTDQVELGGWAMRALALPRKEYSST